MTVTQAQKLSEAAVEEEEEFLLMDLNLKYRHAGSYFKDKLLPWLVGEGKVRAHEAIPGEFVVTMPKRLTRRVQEQERSVSFRSSQAVDGAEAKTVAAEMWSTTTASMKRPALAVDQAPRLVAACMFVVG